jgi:integrase
MDKKIEVEIEESCISPIYEARKTTVSSIIDRFIANELPKKKPKAQKEFIMVLEWFRKEIGQYTLTGITTEILVNCREKLMIKKKEVPMKNGLLKTSEQTLSPATVNKYLTYMRVVFEYCVKDLDLLQINPMSKIRKLSVKNERKRFLSQSEITKLLDKCKRTNQEVYLCTLIALLCGARKSEVLNLTWETVDLENKMFYFLDTKNGEDRGVPMHEFLYKELQAFKVQSKVRNLKKDYIFKTEDGKPKESLIGKLFPKIVKSCGIENFRFHDLRHTQASWQAMSGLSQPITQKTLGHKTSQMTNRYSHLRDDVLRTPINLVGDKMLEGLLKLAQ